MYSYACSQAKSSYINPYAPVCAVRAILIDIIEPMVVILSDVKR